MIEGFLEVIRNIGIFIICAQAVIHFRPKASYEKYLKVLVGIIVLVMLLVPCFQMLGNMESFMYSMEQYENFFKGTGQTVWREQDVWEWQKMDNVQLDDRENLNSVKDDAAREKVKTGLNNEVEPVLVEPVEVIK